METPTLPVVTEEELDTLHETYVSSKPTLPTEESKPAPAEEKAQDDTSIVVTWKKLYKLFKAFNTETNNKIATLSEEHGALQIERRFHEVIMDKNSNYEMKKTSLASLLDIHHKENAVLNATHELSLLRNKLMRQRSAIKNACESKQTNWDDESPVELLLKLANRVIKTMKKVVIQLDY